MPKSKTQAEKQAARSASNEAKAAARAIEKSQRDALIRAQALEGEQRKKQVKEKKAQEKQNKQKHKQQQKEKQEEQQNDETIPFNLSLDSKSSYVSGLSSFLIKLQKLLPACAISCGSPQTCDTQNDDEKFQFEYEPPSGNTVTHHNGYRYVATCGTQMQVVTLTPRSIGGVVMPQDMIQSHINTLLHSVNEDDDEHDTSDASSSYINTNHLVVAEKILHLKEQQSKQHQYQQHQQQKRIHQQKITEIKKTLLTKKLSREDVDELAQRDLDIKSGKDRGKHAMKK